VHKYCNGVQECGEQEDNIIKILNTIKDCNAVLAFKIGLEPINKLLKEGIHVYQMYERINEGIEKAVELLETDANVIYVSK
jgi:predicted Fe-Mo cluster-binding NifX family protein